MTAPRISVAINTLNEEKNLPRALRSVKPWAAQIVVVDMHSDDRTAEVARSFGAEVHLHERLGFADPARAFALAQTKGDWVLILDADELIPRRLGERLVEIAETGACDVVQIPRLNYLLGAPLHHTGWGPAADYHARFFRRGSLTATGTIHDFLKAAPDAKILKLPCEDGLAIVHFNYLDLVHFLDKLNRYTTIEAEQALARGEAVTPVGSVWRALREFWRRYVEAQGFKDGWRGFYLSALMAFYRMSTAAKLAELRAGVGAETAERLYADVAERILAEYEPAARGSASKAG
jgi:glycosyltransferase involved in cell wall biosynthesis